MNWSVIAHIVFPHNLLNVLSGFLSMIEWHVGEEMVGNMGISDVMEVVIKEGSPRAVNCAKGSAQPRPLVVIEVRHVDICVMQVCECHKISVHNKVRDEIIIEKGTESMNRNSPSDQSKDKDHSDITHNNSPIFLRLK